MANYNIVFSTDENYVKHLCVTLISLLNNNRNMSFKIYIINNGITDYHYNNIEAVAEGFECELINARVPDDAFSQLVTNDHFTKAAYYRLLIPDLVAERKVLYLDVDIVVNGKIDKLYNKNIDNYYVAAVEEPGAEWRSELKMDETSRYFNSGMMLINLEKWEKDCLVEKVILFIEKNPRAIRFVDQCGLNAVINGNWKLLPLIYNQQAVIFEENYKCDCFSPEEIRRAKKHPVIVHYTGSSKPWHLLNNHPYKNLYWKYRSMTPYKSFLPDDFTLINIARLIKHAPIWKALKNQLN